MVILGLGGKVSPSMAAELARVRWGLALKDLAKAKVHARNVEAWAARARAEVAQ